MHTGVVPSRSLAFGGVPYPIISQNLRLERSHHLTPGPGPSRKERDFYLLSHWEASVRNTLWETDGGPSFLSYLDQRAAFSSWAPKNNAPQALGSRAGSLHTLPPSFLDSNQQALDPLTHLLAHMVDWLVGGFSGCPTLHTFFSDMGKYIPANSFVGTTSFPPCHFGQPLCRALQWERTRALVLDFFPQQLYAWPSPFCPLAPLHLLLTQGLSPASVAITECKRKAGQPQRDRF